MPTTVSTFTSVLLMIALAWTEWPQVFIGVGLLAFALMWRGFGGRWLPLSPQPEQQP